jgi:hypothetical protein
MEHAENQRVGTLVAVVEEGFWIALRVFISISSGRNQAPGGAMTYDSDLHDGHVTTRSN